MMEDPQNKAPEEEEKKNEIKEFGNVPPPISGNNSEDPLAGIDKEYLKEVDSFYPKSIPALSKERDLLLKVFNFGYNQFAQNIEVLNRAKGSKVINWADEDLLAKFV